MLVSVSHVSDFYIHLTHNTSPSGLMVKRAGSSVFGYFTVSMSIFLCLLGAKLAVGNFWLVDESSLNQYCGMSSVYSWSSDDICSRCVAVEWLLKHTGLGFSSTSPAIVIYICITTFPVFFNFSSAVSVASISDSNVAIKVHVRYLLASFDMRLVWVSLAGSYYILFVVSL